MNKKAVFAVFLVIVSTLFLVMSGLALGEQQDEGEVTVYASNYESYIARLVETFNEKHPDITVNVLSLSGVEAFKRIEAEATDPQCDVMWDMGIATMNEWMHIFQPYKTAAEDYYPEVWKEPNHMWTATAAFVNLILYNTELLTEDEAPKSFKDLADPKWEGKITCMDPTISSMTYDIAWSILQYYGDEGWDIYKEIMMNTRFYRGAAFLMAPEAVAMGEYPLCMDREWMGLRYVAGGGDIALVYPEEGPACEPIAMGLVKNCPHPNAGKLMMEHIASKDFREMALKEFFRRPVRTDIDTAAIWPICPPIDEAWIIDSSAAAAYRPEFLTKFVEIDEQIPDLLAERHGILDLAIADATRPLYGVIGILSIVVVAEGALLWRERRKRS